MSMIPDAHAHIGSIGEVMERVREQIPTLLSISKPDEAEHILHLTGEKQIADIIIPTYGIHPWYADRYTLNEMRIYFDQCRIVGEIGMDNIWCDIPISIQQKRFEEQLQLASSQKKPVILHTKGMEREIGMVLPSYSNTYLVHWYSASHSLERYLDLDCYFSIGPDVWWNEAVKHVATYAPLNRLLIETDGMGAVCWAYEEAPAGTDCRLVPRSIGEALEQILEETARIRGIEREELAVQVRNNFWNFHGERTAGQST